ncbi:mutator type transposase [Tanacetum coccineum]
MFLSQRQYVTEILKRAHMANCNPNRTRVDTESKLGDDGDHLTLYWSLAGTLQYLTLTRPDLSYAAQHMWIGLVALLLGDRLQDIVAEEEYRGVANAVVETCWLRNLLHELHTPLSSAKLVYLEVTSMMKELGYENPCMAYYYKKPNTNLDNGLTELVFDKDVYEMLMYVDKFKVIKLYTNHSIKKKHVFIEEPLVVGTTSEPKEPNIGSGIEAEVDVSSENGSGSENGSSSGSGSDNEDSDYFVDEENLIDDVEVDMADFKSHTYPDVEWVGYEGVRRKALRKVARMHKAKAGKGETIWKENFFVGEQFATRKLVKDKVTRVSVEQRRQLWLKNVKLRLRDYCKELKDRNPNTTVKIEVERPEDPDSEERKFKRIYVCLGHSKEGFRVGGRDFLGLDGCFLSRPYPGQILTIVGVDPNNGIYPLACAVVEYENKDSLKCFLECLGDDLDLFRNSNFTFISDMQKTFPSAEHRFCLKHIYDNMKLSWRGKLYKELLWKCATTTTIQKFDKRMEEMKNHNIEAYEWLRKIPPQHWARSHFSGWEKSNILLNNMFEVLNRQLVDGRDK